MATKEETKSSKARQEAKEKDDRSASPPSDTETSSTKKRKSRSAADSATVPEELEGDLSLPEPPSKRAKRALKKGKPLPPKPQSDDEGGSGKKKKSKEANKDAKDGEKATQYGIWIGNLAFTITRTQLFQWFVDSSGGSITEADITRVNLPTKRGNGADKNKSWNKGFAYVDFATYEAQVAAVALSETELEGRRVLIKDSKSFEGRPKPAQPGAEGANTSTTTTTTKGDDAGSATPELANSTKIFVGNLGFDTTEADLRRHFAPCGSVAWAKVATFPDNTEKCRGYGWVQFGKSAANDDDEEEQQRTYENADVEAKGSYSEMAAIAAAAAVKGFVRIKETVDTEEDFLAEANGETVDEEEKQKQPPKTKMRKWWVNQLKGRPLKIQFAEDDKIRYKKRFGKARPKDEEGSSNGHRHNNNNNNNSNNSNSNNKDRQQRGDRRPRQEKFVKDEGPVVARTEASDKPYNLQDLSVAQRTGAVTASLGKKTVFE